MKIRFASFVTLSVAVVAGLDIAKAGLVATPIQAQQFQPLPDRPFGPDEGGFTTGLDAPYADGKGYVLPIGDDGRYIVPLQYRAKVIFNHPGNAFRVAVRVFEHAGCCGQKDEPIDIVEGEPFYLNPAESVNDVVPLTLNIPRTDRKLQIQTRLEQLDEEGLWEGVVGSRFTVYTN